MSKKKITQKEQKKLQEIVDRTNNVGSKMAQMCLQKEIQIRKINEEFDEAFETAKLHHDQSQRDQNNLLQELYAKYGKNKIFNIDTREITSK